MTLLHERKRLLALTVAVATLAAVGPAAAVPAAEQHCRAVGTDAGEIARLRDAGRSIDEAVTTVAAKRSQSGSAALRSSAALLFERFRRMSPADAEFEFYLDCLDDADSATPAHPPKDGASRS